LCGTSSQQRSLQASTTRRRSVIVKPLIVHDGLTPTLSNISIMRHTPTRWPYSRQVQFAVSSTSPGNPCGIVIGPPVNSGSFCPGRDCSQYSILIVKINASCAPLGDRSGLRSGRGTYG